MNEHFKPGRGAVFSADIAVPDHDREVRFYSRVLATGTSPLWRESDLMNNRGMPIIGLGARTAEYEALPLQWMPHIQVSDVAESARRAVDLGGRELMHGRDEEGRSQWAVLLDPEGAAFGLIPILPSEAMAAGSEGEAAASSGAVGRITRIERKMPGVSDLRSFYRRVIGWSAGHLPVGAEEGERLDSLVIAGNGEPSAGSRNARGRKADRPAVWLIHLPVGDFRESLRRVEEEGGVILEIVRDSGGDDLRAIVRDPVGACFAIEPG